jgi:peptide deformylase
LRVAEPVRSVHDAGFRALLDDLFDTMHAERGAGLAAPQIGENVRVVVFGFDANPRYPEAPPVPRTVLVNPTIEPVGDALVEGWEGCLSVPGLRGVVPRHARIRYTGIDERGVRIDRVAEGFHARVVQHEVDHLDGVLYPMRIRDFSRFGFIEALFPARPPEGDD